ncbi:MAG TPA: hypothetical protein VEU96_31220, partial [Bryobacteraceae bacterium]|nr:hypothetical protein [Bryobacteraceae bacterium]
MKRPARRLRLVLAMAAAVTGVNATLVVRAASPSFTPAYFRPSFSRDQATLLTLFPMVGPEATVPLPTGLPLSFRLLAFSRDGKAIYGQKQDPLGPSSAIIKIEFKPTRQSEVPGSAGLGAVWFLTESQQSGKIYVSAWSKNKAKGECGAFEIDSDSGTFRTLRVGIYGDCGAVTGPVSPDGKRVLGRQSGRLGILDLEKGDFHELGARMTEASWSPDGQLIAACDGGRL